MSKVESYEIGWDDKFIYISFLDENGEGETYMYLAEDAAGIRDALILALMEQAGIV